jgi:hypothetical protein
VGGSSWDSVCTLDGSYNEPADPSVKPEIEATWRDLAVWARRNA